MIGALVGRAASPSELAMTAGRASSPSYDPMTFPSFPRDTSLEALRVQIEAWKRLGMDGRWKLTFELSENLGRVLAEGVRMRHPEYTDDRVRLATIRLRIGDKLFREVYPGVEVQP